MCAFDIYTDIPRVTSFDEIENEYTKALSWISEFGLSVLGTRLWKYRDSLKIIVDTLGQGSEVTISHDELFGPYWEIQTIVHIYDGLRRLSVVGLRERLQKLLGGHALICEEKWNNSARQTAFELMLASSLAKQGVVVDLSTTADVKFEFDGDVYYVECKYLLSDLKVKRNIRKALCQLDRRYSAVSGQRKEYGIVALCVDYLYNRNFGVLTKSSHGQRLEEMGKGVVSFFRDNKKYFDRNANANTLGAFVCITLPYYNESYSDIGVVGLDGAYSYRPEGDVMFDKFMRLGKMLVDGYNR